jgi:hypothetical protein
MSANRRETGQVVEITFQEWLDACEERPMVRVQGKVESATQQQGRLVRFNRVCVVNPADVQWRDGDPYIRVQRMRWNKDRLEWEWKGEFMTLAWRLLDWVTWKINGDPNDTWVKVVEIDNESSTSYQRRSA